MAIFLGIGIGVGCSLVFFLFFPKTRSTIMDHINDRWHSFPSLRGNNKELLGEIASGIVHDLGTPLTTLLLVIGEIQERITKTQDPRLIELTERALRSVGRIEVLIAGMQRLIKNQEKQEFFAVRPILEESLGVLAHKADHLGIQITVRCPETLHIFGNTLRFSQLITNLLANALDAYKESASSREGKSLELLAYQQDDICYLTLEDQATGIEKGSLDGVFSQEFTTKEEIGGTGIGLSLCRTIAENEFHGALGVESAKGGRTTFLLAIPMSL